MPQDREVYYSKAIAMYFTDRAQDSAILKVRWEERRAGLCEGSFDSCNVCLILFSQRLLYCTVFHF